MYVWMNVCMDECMRVSMYVRMNVCKEEFIYDA